jgi:oxaloacetate decarboxylase gamma subunit
MTIAEMFGQSGILALLGMGIVISFLLILIAFMTLVAKAIQALGWDKESEPAQVSAAPARAAGTNSAVMAAISAAVKQYRNKQGS